jgi:hypothetical protein
MRLSLLLLLIVALLGAGCAPRRAPVAKAPGAPSRVIAPEASSAECETPEEQEIVVYAKYVPFCDSKSNEPKSAFQHVIDAFHVEHKVRGDFPIAELRVNCKGVIGPDYPVNLEPGKHYYLQIKPTERLKREVARYEEETIDWLSVAPEEIALAMGND